MAETKKNVSKMSLFDDEEDVIESKSVRMTSLDFELLKNSEDTSNDSTITEDNKKPSRKSPVGSYDKSLFEDSFDNKRDTITTINTDLDYDELLKEIESSTQDSDTENVKKLEAFNDFAIPVKDNVISDDVIENPVLEGIAIKSGKKDNISRNKIRIRELTKNIKSLPNYLEIIDLKDIYCSKNRIFGKIGDSPLSLELVGFTNRFEAVIKFSCDEEVLTGGCAYLFEDSNKQYIMLQVEMFAINEPIVLNINNHKFLVRFIELNKKRTDIKSLIVFDIQLVSIKEIQ